MAEIISIVLWLLGMACILFSTVALAANLVGRFYWSGRAINEAFGDNSRKAQEAQGAYARWNYWTGVLMAITVGLGMLLYWLSKSVVGET